MQHDMGSVRGRAVLDFLRHRLKFPHTAQYDTKQFWEMSYASAVRPHEWGCAGDKLLSYAFRDASTHRPAAGAPGVGTLAADCAAALEGVDLVAVATALTAMVAPCVAALRGPLTPQQWQGCEALPDYGKIGIAADERLLDPAARRGA